MLSTLTVSLLVVDTDADARSLRISALRQFLQVSMLSSAGDNDSEDSTEVYLPLKSADSS